MKFAKLALLAAGAALFAAPVFAQQATPPANPLDVVPDQMPFNTPYGAPINLARAQQLISAVVAETKKRGWAMNIAVIDSGGNLVAFERMDGAQLASIAISQHKARSALLFRRESKIFEDAIQHGVTYVETLDGMIGSRGGFPLIENGKIIGAIGCSGGTGSQDATVCGIVPGMLNK